MTRPETVQLPLYQIDAFATCLFAGNPAAVVPLQEWLSDKLMQAIAAENNLSETAFFVREEGGARIRWFTPACEVKLCGHATLATAWVWFHHFEPQAEEVVFDSLSGPLTVTRSGDLLTLDFPAQTHTQLTPPDALGVRSLTPQIALGKQLDCRALIVTALGDDCDFVSRVFGPKVGIDEDPVTGSAHTKLVPYWAEKSGKQKLHARQLSKRSGELFCEQRGERVLMSGRAVPYLSGTLTLPMDTTSTSGGH